MRAFLGQDLTPSSKTHRAQTGDGKAVGEVIAGITGQAVETTPLVDRRAWRQVMSRHLCDVFGAALLWLVYDIVVYSSILFGPSVIAKGIGVSLIVFQLVSCGVFVIPGTVLGIGLIDGFGRKPLAATGFTLAGGSLVLFAATHDSAAGALLQKSGSGADGLRWVKFGARPRRSAIGASRPLPRVSARVG